MNKLPRLTKEQVELGVEDVACKHGNIFRVQSVHGVTNPYPCDCEKRSKK